MKDTDKVTLTIGQLKQLINEAKQKRKRTKKQLNEYETYMGADGKLYDDEGNVVSGDYARRHRVDMWDDPSFDRYNDYGNSSYNRKRRSKYRDDWSNLPGYGDPETWGGREPR